MHHSRPEFPRSITRSPRPPNRGAVAESLEPRRLLSTAVWTGAAGDGQWFTPNNWQGEAVPTAGESVQFPATSPGLRSVVALSQNVEVGDLSIGGSYTIQGSTITVDGTLSADGIDQISSDVKDAHLIDVGRDQYDSGATLTIAGSFTGSGGIFLNEETPAAVLPNGILKIEGPTADLGQIYYYDGTLDAESALAGNVFIADSDLGDGVLEGNGSVQGVVVANTGNVTLGQGDQAYTLTSNGSATLAHLRELITGDDTAGELIVTGSSSTIAFYDLFVAIAPYVPVPFGQTFTLISNQTGNAVGLGPFPVYPQGSIFNEGGVNYQISYKGGASGKDATLTVVNAESSLSLASSRTLANQGESVALTATASSVASYAGQPTGTVTFYDRCEAIGTAPLSNGTAVLRDSALPVGSNSITASYSGDTDFASAATASGLGLTIHAHRPGTTPTISSAPASATTAGTTIALNVTASDTGPSGAGGLKYTWSAIRLPAGAKMPRFNVNGTNAAQNIIARFSKAGGYILQCDVKNAAGNAATADVSVTVRQTATSLKIEPHDAHIAGNATEQFAGTVLDQFGHSMQTPQTLTYAVASGGGSITPTGLFSASSISGPVTIEVEADDLTSTVGAVVG